MRTVKEVADLTGISVRTLQYYDEIGVFKPTKITVAGYRLYNDKSLETLQQILFFKELDFQLKDIKKIIETPNFNKIEAFKKQKKLLKAKRDRLDGLLKLLDKLEKGEACMSFKEFDLSDYWNVLEQFKNENAEEVIKYWGSIDAFEQFIKKGKGDEAHIAELAIKQYGSIEKYTNAIKESINHFSENMEKIESINVNEYIEKSKLIMSQLVKDTTKNIKSEEIQNIVKELITLVKETSPTIDMGENYWNILADAYLHNTVVIETNDKLYGIGASKFIGKAVQYYFANNQM